MDKRIIRHMEVPRRTYFYWKGILNDQGMGALVNKQRPGPKQSFHIDPKTKSMILKWRKRYGWGPGRIEGHLDRHYNMHVPHKHSLMTTPGS